jgi:glycosyltransferase involved in cell wall biosynthesis
MKLSVIIPVYNREKYIKVCIESVLNQKNPGCKYEVIVVDDGSTDNTPRILSEFKDKIIYKRIENSGRPSVPRNIGLKLAKGELIAFQDSDDIWISSKLQAQLKDFKADYVLSYANAEVIDENRNLLGRNIIDNKQAYSGNVFEYLLKENFVSTLTVIANKKIMLDLGGFNESVDYLEDYDMWLRMSLHGKFIYTPKILARYRVHKSNISTGSEKKDLMMIYNIMNRLSREVECQDKILVNDRRVEIATRIADASGAVQRLEWLILCKHHKLQRRLYGCAHSY